MYYANIGSISILIRKGVSMFKKNWSQLLVYVGIFVLLIMAVIIAYKIFTDNQQIVAAIIGAIGAVIAVLFTATSNQYETRKQRQHQLKQENYKELINNLVEYIHKPKDNERALAKTLFSSWTVGSQDVVISTQELINSVREDKSNEVYIKIDSGSVKKILLEIRKDLEFDCDKLKETTLKGAFSTPNPPNPEGYLSD